MKNERTKPTLASTDLCTGCSACSVACPTSSIVMERDEEGFLFPKVLDTCIYCRKCEKLCPVINPVEYKKEIKQRACAAIHKNEQIWRKSASGGAFSGICEVFGDEKTIVFGAVYCPEDYTVRHIFVEGVDNIGALRRSKYVQSDIYDSYLKTKLFLEEGKKVIFTGTPCQIAGLNAVLKEKQYENLLTVDLVCHGVGSPLVFKTYNDICEKEHNSPVKDFQFREKKIRFGVHNLYPVKIEYENGIFEQNSNDMYSNLFLQRMVCRKSCFDCRFMNMDRQGDLTIADFKQLYSIIPEAPADKNASSVIANTKKGAEVFDRLAKIMEIYACDVKEIENSNPPLRGITESSERRNAFFSDFCTSEDKLLVMKKYQRKYTLVEKVKQKAPEKIKTKIKKLVK